jgi:multiple sugar transport system substrate-binding protein
MSLLENDSIINNNHNNAKKSILLANRIDLMIIIVLVILLAGPFVSSLFLRREEKAKQVNLYLSPRCEELFTVQIMEKLLLEFEEQNQDIKIRIGTVSVDENKGKNAPPAVVVPDVFIFDEGEFSALVAENSLLELNSFTNYDSGSVQLAIPLVSFMDLLFYNINILSKAGFDSPPKSRDAFLTCARTVSKGDFNASGAAISLNPNDRQSLSRDIFSWIWAGGGNLWTDEKGPSINTRPIINDLTFLGILNREGLLAPNIFETTGNQRIEQFAQGKLALMIASTRAIPYLRERMGDDAFGITTIPDSGTGGKYSISPSAIYTGINSESTHPEEAWRFLEFLAERSSLLCAELKAIPGVVSDIIPGEYVKDDFFYSKAWDIFESARITEGFTGKPYAMEYKAAVLEELEKFFTTNRSAQETVNAIQRRWDTWDIPEMPPGEDDKN